MAVKVTLNKASLRLEEKIVRAVAGKTERTDKLVRAFARSPAAKEIQQSVLVSLNNLHSAIMWVMSGGVAVGGPIATLNTPAGAVTLKQPWRPLSEAYLKEKKGPSFWRETGDLEAYIAQQLAVLAGPGAVKRVEVKAAKVQRGAKTVRARMLITPARLPEPLQTLVMYPFLQGDWVRLSAKRLDGNEAKLLANSLLRGFMPDIATEFGLRALDSVRSK